MKSNPLLPLRIGKYELLELLAKGGQAELFRGRLLGANDYSKTVAIKRFNHDAETQGSRSHRLLEREIHLTSLLQHPNIVQTHDFIEDGASSYLVMEFVSGKNLFQINQKRREKNLELSIEGVLYIVSNLCLGLDYAHQKTDPAGIPLEIIHRDVSPQNILVSYEGHVKIVDFGVAKANDTLLKTKTGLIVGKLHYLSPEQISREPIDARVDVYATGLLLFELLTGKVAIPGKNEAEVISNILKGLFPAPSSLNPKVSSEIDSLFLKCVALEKRERFASCAEVFGALQYHAKAFPGFSSTQMRSLMQNWFSTEIEIETKSRSVKINSPENEPPKNHDFGKIPFSKLAGATLLGFALLIGITLFLVRKSLDPITPRNLSTESPTPAQMDFERETAFQWLSPRIPFKLDPNGLDQAELVVGRWNYSPISNVLINFGTSTAITGNPNAIDCRINSSTKCGPVLLTGKAPFPINFKPYQRYPVDPVVKISVEFCKQIHESGSIMDDGTCTIRLDPGKWTLKLEFAQIMK